MTRTNNKLLGAVFFKFTDEKKSQPLTILKSLIYQIARYFPEIQSSVDDLLKNFKVPWTVLNVFDKILLPSLEAMQKNTNETTMKNMTIIFDAIDEAAVVGSEARKQLLRLFSSKFLCKLPCCEVVYNWQTRT